MKSKLFYTKPLMAMEQFVPQEFIAQCAINILNKKLNLNVWADLWDDVNNTSPVFANANGLTDGVSYVTREHFNRGFAPTINREGWYRGYQLFTEVEFGSNAPYTNTRYFAPFLNKGDLYLTSRRAWFYEGGAPADADPVNDPVNSDGTKNFS